MAVEDKFVNSDVAAGDPSYGYKQHGSEIVIITETFETAAADDDGSVYRVFPNLSPHLVPLKIDINNDVITGGTDFDLGIYDAKGLTDGAVKDKDVLADGLDLSSAHVVGSELSGLSAVDVADLGKALYELAGDTIGAIKSGYDIALTANTVGSGVGTITVTGYFTQKF